MRDVQQRQSTYLQGDDSLGTVSSYPMASGGEASEISCSNPKVEEAAVAGHGGEVVSKEESLPIQEPGTCQFVNEQQQQPRSQLSAQANVPSSRTQEIGLDGLQRRDRQEVRYPIQETESSAEWVSNGHEDLPLCHPQLNGPDVNGVSSTGQREQAVEHNCSRQELKLWKQDLIRQDDVAHTTFPWEIKYIVKI